MKFPSLKPRSLKPMRCMVPAAVFGALAVLSLPAQALSEGEDAYGNRFVSGGVTNDELRELQSRKDEHQLSLVTASDRGAYLAGVLVRIVDSSGNVALETEMDGPWLLADLPPGSYTLEANFEGQQKR